MLVLTMRQGVLWFVCTSTGEGVKEEEDALISCAVHLPPQSKRRPGLTRSMRATHLIINERRR